MLLAGSWFGKLCAFKAAQAFRETPAIIRLAEKGKKLKETIGKPIVSADRNDHASTEAQHYETLVIFNSIRRPGGASFNFNEDNRA